MSYYKSLGLIPPKRHTQFRQHDGSLYHEELMGLGGFADDSALLYHINAPMPLRRVEATKGPEWSTRPNQPLMPYHLQTSLLDAPDADAVTGRRPLVANEDLRISYVSATQESPIYRNAVGDECVFVQSGEARFESVFGVLDIRAGDYVVIPAAVTHRWIPKGDTPFKTLVIETLSSGHVHPPERYLSPRGQFLEHAPYCERDLRSPTELLVCEGTDVDVLLQTRDGWSTVTYVNHPFDVIGWDGSNYPYAVNIKDFEPITGRIHQPPPVHQILEAPGAVICAFVPRKLDYHPLSLPSPYAHSNVDSDELLFYMEGDFMSRSGAGMKEGSITMHPAGFIHGSHPGALERSIGAQQTAEYALMLDTFRPLYLAEGADACADQDYAWSWTPKSD
ncbi:homogentisate 1,2-dioxygenase [Rhodococcus sp. T2V]|uniref:homogentisate 1,2-dioxygenase n=1 Tax=Rhodococcus sp. T2V TaxID=3034164 RepID=UPI0023E34DCC|nr:cupin domain-containing protein [Rhodococcus sp. T2V]MDF3313173.1 homogentisate 1,2-dioxygenase [Rhodococcus sp. T2V]